MTCAAFERFLEIISEASRHVPDDLKASTPAIPWQDIANIGIRLRHAYDALDPEVLWNIYVYDLGLLEFAVDKMLSEKRREPE